MQTCLCELSVVTLLFPMRRPHTHGKFTWEAAEKVSQIMKDPQSAPQTYSWGLAESTARDANDATNPESAARLSNSLPHQGRYLVIPNWTNIILIHWTLYFAGPSPRRSEEKDQQHVTRTRGVVIFFHLFCLCLSVSPTPLFLFFSIPVSLPRN